MITCSTHTMVGVLFLAVIIVMSKYNISDWGFYCRFFALM